MSLQNRPNFHAASFLTDVMKSIEENIRGTPYPKYVLANTKKMMREDILEVVETEDNANVEASNELRE